MKQQSFQVSNETERQLSELAQKWGLTDARYNTAAIAHMVATFHAAIFGPPQSIREQLEQHIARLESELKEARETAAYWEKATREVEDNFGLLWNEYLIATGEHPDPEGYREMQPVPEFITKPA